MSCTDLQMQKSIYDTVMKMVSIYQKNSCHENGKHLPKNSIINLPQWKMVSIYQKIASST